MIPDLIHLATECLKLLPSLLWFAFIVIIFVLFYRPIRDDLLPNLTGFKAMGVEISLIEDSIDEALELAEKSPQWKVEVPEKDKERVLNRAKRHLKIFKNAQFLWVDDVPTNNRNELKMFRHLKVEIDTAEGTEQALEMLKKRHYDIVISDMARGKEPTAGLVFLEKFREFNQITPVVFYIGVYDPGKGNPSLAFGITNRPDELLHLTLDALERKKY